MFQNMNSRGIHLTAAKCVFILQFDKDQHGNVVGLFGIFDGASLVCQQDPLFSPSSTLYPYETEV